MRKVFALVLLLAGIGCGYVFATGAVDESWQGDRVLAPFRELSVASAALLAVAGLASVGFVVCREQPGVVARRAWRKALEFGFLINALFVAGVIAAIWLFAIRGDSESTQTVGALFAAGLVELTLGTLLAVTLFFMQKAKTLYFSVLGLHVAEALVLGVIFILGSSA